MGEFLFFVFRLSTPYFTRFSTSSLFHFHGFRYKTQFDQLAKIDVNGDNEEPLFTFLKEQMPDEEVKGLKNKAVMAQIAKISHTCQKPSDIKWNFTKFLVDRDGNVVKRYDPTSDPADFESDIAALL